MDTVLLRTLTQKSFMKFGKYHDLKVGEVLKADHQRYLRWVYFNSSMISFVDEILDIIGIDKKYRINKPGKFPEIHRIINEEKSKKMNFYSKKHFEKIKRIRKQCSDIKFNIVESKSTSKERLRIINHGHK